MDSSSGGGRTAPPRRNRGGGGGRWFSFGAYGDLFDIPAKGATLKRLKKWRQAALVLNASRRFRYTLDFKEVEKNEEVRRNLRAQAQVKRAAFCFKEIDQNYVQSKEAAVPHAEAEGTLGFGIKEDQLSALTREHNYSDLQQYGGIYGVANMLQTDTEKGINEDDSGLMARRNSFGSNTYPHKKGRRFLAFILDACKDLTLIILMVAAAVSMVSGIIAEGINEGWYGGASIAFAILLVVFVTAISDYTQSLQFQNLNAEKQNIRMEVVRGGRRIMVPIHDLVIGDVVFLKTGDQIPTDGILISGYSLSIDESSMTGESRIVHKDQKSPFLISGCKVADGYGTMLVTAVGINTEWGLLMASISEDSGEETPLQVRLNGVATFVGMVGLYVALATLVVLFARCFCGHTYNHDGSVQYVKGKMGVGDMICVIVRIFTVAVELGHYCGCGCSEGLPLAVTLTLAFSMSKMMRENALVRRLSACETMGAATTICSNKTGTWTSNQMTVVEGYFGGKKMDSPDNAQMLSANVTSLIIEGIVHNTSGSIFQPQQRGQQPEVIGSPTEKAIPSLQSSKEPEVTGSPTEKNILSRQDGQEPEVTGSPTEKAILSWGLKLGMKFNDTQLKSSVLHVLPFSSEKKRGGVAVQQGGSEVHIHWKRAAETILDSCTSWLDSDRSRHSMTPEKVVEFKKFIEDMAAASLRCIAFAFRVVDFPSEYQRAEWKLPEDNLIMLGIVGIKDPCRPGVQDAIRLCQAASIKVRMVTGDNLQTARAIALECGILDDPNVSEPVIIEGKTFQALSYLDREEAAEKISVMGASSSEHKILLVNALKKRGHVVAVTGGDKNDAPALHEADIGLSMGIQGTEVAKESSDIIILDGNFASVVRVVRWGRSVHANIQKVMQFQLTVNITALMTNVVAAVGSGNVPLNTVQLLWVNLIMDTLGALALATEPPTDHLMKRPPIRRREPLIGNIMWRNLIIMAFFQVSVLLTLNFKGISLLQLENDNPAHAHKVKNTLIFNTFVLYQVFNEFNSREPDELNIFKGILWNHLFITVIGITVIVQALTVEFLGKFASTVRLSWQLWLVSIGLAFLSWPLAFLGKLIPVPKRPFGEILLHTAVKGAKLVVTRGNWETTDRNDHIVV